MTESPNNLPFLFAAFAVVWAIFFNYAAYMSWRRQSVQKELRELQQMVVSGSESNTDDAEPAGYV